MKGFLDVEKVRREQYSNSLINSNHRSSLLVPALPNSEASISFLNHFLLKRNISSVACKITAISQTGKKISSRLLEINEPRVHSIYLQDYFDESAACFLVEFFSSKNLFIPFPAVMINHKCVDSISSVHSFNRVLNDVFEDEEINSIHVSEAAIDLVANPDLSGFFVISSGPFDLRGEVALKFVNSEIELNHVLYVDIPRLTQQMFLINDLVPSWPKTGGTLLINQPKQPLFYGRLFVGQIAPNGSFVGNHSYYDSSNVAGEYWPDGRPSWRTYPIIDGLDVLVRAYPIMSPSSIVIYLVFNRNDGSTIGSSNELTIKSPHGDSLEIDIRTIAKSNGIDLLQATSFTVYASPESGNAPSRLNHQIVYKKDAIESSINASLFNYHVFHSATNLRTFWGQLINSENCETWLSITNDSKEELPSKVDVKFYSEAGLFATKSLDVSSHGAATINATEFFASTDIKPQGEFVWYMLESANHFLTGFSITRHLVSNHCTGEHSF